MNKIITLVVAFLLFIPFASINGSNVASNTSTNNILYVGGSGPDNYTSIQSAINDADNGYTIYVYAGIYREHVRIYKPINLIGEDENTTIIDGMNETNVTVFSISASHVNFSHFTIRNALDGFWTKAISISGNYIYIHKDIITNCGGMHISSSNTLIENCNLSYNYLGVSVGGGSSNLTIKNCIMSFNLGKKNKDGGYIGGNGIESGGSNTSIINCTIHHSRFDGISIVDGSNICIYGCDISGHYPLEGIYLGGVKNGTISNCELHDNNYGITLVKSECIKIKNCSITESSWSGIRIMNEEKKSEEAIINSCDIKNNSCGIEILNSLGISVNYNNICNNSIGMKAEFSVCNARNNYWGNPFGPSHLFGLRGDKIQTTLAKVFYFPWLKEGYGNKLG